MSDLIHVKPSEKGAIRLFQIDLPTKEAQAFANPPGDTATEWPLQSALGTPLAPEYVEFFALSDLEELGLAGYLIEGNGVAEEDLAQDRAMLESLKGSLLILYSAAFKGHEATLHIRAPLRWIATYHEARAPRTGPAPKSAAALPYTAPPPPSQNVQSNTLRGLHSIAIAVLIIFALILWTLL